MCFSEKNGEHQAPVEFWHSSHVPSNVGALAGLTYQLCNQASKVNLLYSKRLYWWIACYWAQEILKGNESLTLVQSKAMETTPRLTLSVGMKGKG